LAITAGEVANNDKTPMIATTATDPNVTFGLPYVLMMGLRHKHWYNLDLFFLTQRLHLSYIKMT
jgi:hypothetical protein